MGMEKALSDGMVDAECTKFSRNGKLFYLTTSLHASAQAGMKPAMCAAFKKAGYDGFLSSEYEGGEHLRPFGPVDSVEQVRRHQEALRRAIED